MTMPVVALVCLALSPLILAIRATAARPVPVRAVNRPRRPVRIRE
jgi:hypothetical protein